MNDKTRGFAVWVLHPYNPETCSTKKGYLLESGETRRFLKPGDKIREFPDMATARAAIIEMGYMVTMKEPTLPTDPPSAYVTGYPTDAP